MKKSTKYTISIIFLTAALIVIASCLIVNDQPMEVRSNLVLAANDNGLGNDILGFKRADGKEPVHFPADFGPHPDYQTEWWYYTGNLDTDDGHHFGYQLTFFRRALLPPNERTARLSRFATDQVYMAHFALSDIAANKHYAFERLSRGAAGIAGAQASPYEVWLENWYVKETDLGVYHLYASQDGLILNLQLVNSKEPVLHGINGYSQKGPDPGNASYYYSQTRLVTDGSVNINGKLSPVVGLSWMDHEYSTSALSEGQVGWDWFSIQLDDFQELMIYQIRRDDGLIDVYSDGTLINSDGSSKALDRTEFEIAVQDSWKSPTSLATYPSNWIIRIPAAAIELEIRPYMPSQEMNLSYSYWEGAVNVEGKINGKLVHGVGYVEMTGYAGSMSGEF